MGPGEKDIVSDQISSLRTEFREVFSRLETRFMEMERKIDENHSLMMESLKKDLKVLQGRCEKAEARNIELEATIDDLIDTQGRSLNLRVTNIPRSENENLNQIADAIKSRLGFNDFGDPHTIQYRLKNGLSKNTMILRFMSIADKDFFFSRYLKEAKLLKVKDVIPNHNGSERFFISQDLSLTQYKLHRAAIKQKTEGKIKDVRIQYGFVTAQLHNSGKFIRPMFNDKLQEAIEKDARLKTTSQAPSSTSTTQRKASASKKSTKNTNKQN